MHPLAPVVFALAAFECGDFLPEGDTNEDWKATGYSMFNSTYFRDDGSVCAQVRAEYSDSLITLYIYDGADELTHYFTDNNSPNATIRRSHFGPDGKLLFVEAVLDLSANGGTYYALPDGERVDFCALEDLLPPIYSRASYESQCGKDDKTDN